MKHLTWCTAAKAPSLTGTPLDELVKEMMTSKEERLEKSLQRFNYRIDGVDTLRLICSAGHLEQVRHAALL
jgi:hypothetical protein